TGAGFQSKVVGIMGVLAAILDPFSKWFEKEETTIHPIKEQRLEETKENTTKVARNRVGKTSGNRILILIQDSVEVPISEARILETQYEKEFIRAQDSVRNSKK